MKKLVVIFSIFTSISWAHIDFGVHGELYDIKEKDFFEEVKEGVKNIDVEEVRASVKKEVMKQAKKKTSLPYCQEDNERTELDYVVLKENIYNPSGRLYKKKGTKVFAPLSEAFDVCFVDGSNDVMLKNQIDYFDKKTDKKCVYMVSDKNIIDLWKTYPNRANDFYPTGASFEKRFNVSCYPTRVHMINNDRTLYEKGLERFKTNNK